MFPPRDLLLEYWTEHVDIVCQIYVPIWDILQGSSRLRDFCMLVHYLEIRHTRTYLSDATTVPMVASSGDESFEFSSTRTFKFYSSSNYSLSWSHIIIKLQHFVYHRVVNNILKHEGDILHICDGYGNAILMALSVQIDCFRRVTKGFPVAYFYFIGLTTHAWRESACPCWFVSLT